MDINSLGTYINQYGFPIITSVFMGYIIYYVWHWTTTIVKPILEESNTVIINLIDKIRVLDNDMIRLHQKLTTIVQLKIKRTRNSN